AQFRRHLRGTAALHRRAPEGTPGRVLEAAAHLLRGPREQPLLVLLLPAGGQLVLPAGLRLQPELGARAAATLRLAGCQEVPELVPHDREEPAPERAARRVVLQPADGAADGP